MGESYWERRQRELNENHAARRAESRRFGRLLRGQARIDETNARIAAGSADPRVDRMGADWTMKQTALVERVSGHPDLPAGVKATWCRALESTGFTRTDDADLTALYHEILASKIETEGPFGPWTFGLVPIAAAVRELIDLRAEARRLRSQ